MSSCNCIYIPSRLSNIISRETHEYKAHKNIPCFECDRLIGKGEKHRIEIILQRYGRFEFRTCMVCASIRDAFFCDGWVYGNVLDYLEKHIAKVNGEISESCLANLKPEAREIVCEMIEKYWSKQEGMGSSVPQ